MRTPVLSKIVMLGLLLGAAACSAPYERVDLDGEKGWRITCGGVYSRVSDCYERAGQLCGAKGFTVVRESDIKPPSSDDYFWNAAAHEAYVKCSDLP